MFWRWFTKEPKKLTVEQVKNITQVVVIDDKKPDEIIKHIRKEGWNIQYLKDVDALSNKLLRAAHIVCLDIKGVGGALGLRNGMELAKAIKDEYPEKKIILYSTLSQHDIFDVSVDLVDKRLRKESSLVPFSSSVQELAMKTLNWDDAIQHAYRKIGPLIGAGLSLDEFKGAVYRSVSGGKLDEEKLAKYAKLTGAAVSVVGPLVKLAIHSGN